MKYKTSLVVFAQLLYLSVALGQTPEPESIPVTTDEPVYVTLPPRFNTNYYGDDNLAPRPGGIGGSLFVTPFQNGFNSNILNAIPSTLIYGYPGIKPNLLYEPIFNTRFQTYDVNNIGNINCIVNTDNLLNGLDEVDNITDVNSCFKMKKSWQRPKDGEKLSEKQLLESDQIVCGCLKGKTTFTSLQAILNTETPNLPNFSTSNAFGNFQRHLNIVKNKVNNRHEMISLQASIIFDGNVRFASEYTESNKIIAAGIKVDQKIIPVSKDAQMRASERTELADKIKAELDNLKKERRRPNMDLYSEKPFAGAPQQCISFRAFISQKTSPRSKEIIESFNGPFLAKDWDYKGLRASYKQFMGENPRVKKRNKDKIEELKSKILFLDANPMIKNVIAASQNLPDYLKDPAVPQATRDLVKEKFSTVNLAKIQGDLFSVMQNFSQQKDNAKQYRDKLSYFFANNDIKQLNDLMTEVEDQRDQTPLKSEEAFLPPDMFKAENLTQRALEEEFMKSTGLSNPDECTEGGVEITKCAETYAGYCRTIDTALDTISQMDDEPSVVNDLDSQLNDLLNPDIATNETFRQFNKDMCDTPRRKKGDKSRKAQGVTFFQFKEEFCTKNTGAAECALNSPDDYDKIRKAYSDEYSNRVDQRDGNMSDAEFNENNEAMNDAPVTVIASIDAKNMFTPGRNSNGFSPQTNGTNTGVTSALENQAESKPVPFFGLAKGLSNLSSAMGGSSDASDGVVENQMNYASTVLGGAQVPGQNSEAPKIENMPQPEREELLEDWKKEMADWKAKKESPNAAQSAVASANETAMKSKIEALEQLLSQQKKLTEDQYKLLNDSIAAQTRTADRSIASVQDDSEEGPRTNRRRSSNGIVGSNTDVGDETQRSPGNVAEQINTSGSGNGGGAATSRSRSSTSNAISDNARESVAREEAKLVNLRENSNGSITITSSASGATASSANAIVVSVSDAFYQSAQSNPTGLNLSQLEQSIPKDQIAKLQDKGDYFILLLQNGSNPPLEVKVKKENNKLVQVDGAPIVSRRVSLDSLRNTLR